MRTLIELACSRSWGLLGPGPAMSPFMSVPAGVVAVLPFLTVPIIDALANLRSGVPVIVGSPNKRPVNIAFYMCPIEV